MLWYLLEAFYRGASNEYPQHMFLCGNKKILTYASLIWSSEMDLTHMRTDMRLVMTSHVRGMIDKF